VLMDLATARRAEGLEIDWVETVQGAGLAIKNPNAPHPVRSLSVAELSQRLSAGTITVGRKTPTRAGPMPPFRKCGRAFAPAHPTGCRSSAGCPGGSSS